MAAYDEFDCDDGRQSVPRKRQRVPRVIKKWLGFHLITKIEKRAKSDVPGKLRAWVVSDWSRGTAPQCILIDETTGTQPRLSGGSVIPLTRICCGDAVSYSASWSI